MKIFLGLIIVVVLLVIATLFKNHVPLFDPPGLKKRLAVYLTTNTARTARDHPFPELRTPVFEAAPDVLYIAVKDAAINLGWSILDSDDVAWTLDMAAKTQFLLFVDDVRVEIIPEAGDDGVTRTALHIHSRSRLGKADFGANADHIRQLVKAVDRRLQLGFQH